MEIGKVCEVKLSYSSKVKASERPKINNSRDIYWLLKESVFDNEVIEHREFFNVILLNRAGRVLGFHTVSVGGIAACCVDIRVIMQAAILANASGVILAHNHPSGSVSPSSNDDQVTQKVSEACKIMGMNLLDHLIISSERYYSYADECRL